MGADAVTLEAIEEHFKFGTLVRSNEEGRLSSPASALSPSAALSLIYGCIRLAAGQRADDEEIAHLQKMRAKPTIKRKAGWQDPGEEVEPDQANEILLNPDYLDC